MLPGLFSATGLLHGARTTVLNTLAWMMALLMSSLIASVYAKAPEWMAWMLAGMAGVDFLVFIGAYIYFAITNSDALRSERYSIQKLAIENKLVGDSTSGLFLPDLQQTQPREPVQTLQIEKQS